MLTLSLVLTLSAYVAIALPMAIAALSALVALRPYRPVVADDSLGATWTPMSALEATSAPARPRSRVSYGSLRGRMGRVSL